MKQAIAFLIFNIFCTFNVIAQDYLCIPNSAAGFAYNHHQKNGSEVSSRSIMKRKFLKKLKMDMNGEILEVAVDQHVQTLINLITCTAK